MPHYLLQLSLGITFGHSLFPNKYNNITLSQKFLLLQYPGWQGWNEAETWLSGNDEGRVRLVMSLLFCGVTTWQINTHTGPPLGSLPPSLLNLSGDRRNSTTSWSSSFASSTFKHVGHISQYSTDTHPPSHPLNVIKTVLSVQPIRENSLMVCCHFGDTNNMSGTGISSSHLMCSLTASHLESSIEHRHQDDQTNNILESVEELCPEKWP